MSIDLCRMCEQQRSGRPELVSLPLLFPSMGTRFGGSVPEDCAFPWIPGGAAPDRGY